MQQEIILVFGNDSEYQAWKKENIHFANQHNAACFMNFFPVNNNPYYVKTKNGAFNPIENSIIKIYVFAHPHPKNNDLIVSHQGNYYLDATILANIIYLLLSSLKQARIIVYLRICKILNFSHNFTKSFAVCLNKYLYKKLLPLEIQLRILASSGIVYSVNSGKEYIASTATPAKKYFYTYAKIISCKIV